MNLKKVPFLAFEISWRFQKTHEYQNRLLFSLNKAIAVEELSESWRGAYFLCVRFEGVQIDRRPRILYSLSVYI